MKVVYFLGGTPHLQAWLEKHTLRGKIQGVIINVRCCDTILAHFELTFFSGYPSPIPSHPIPSRSIPTQYWLGMLILIYLI